VVVERTLRVRCGRVRRVLVGVRRRGPASSRPRGHRGSADPRRVHVRAARGRLDLGLHCHARRAAPRRDGGALPRLRVAHHAGALRQLRDPPALGGLAALHDRALRQLRLERRRRRRRDHPPRERGARGRRDARSPREHGPVGRQQRDDLRLRLSAPRHERDVGQAEGPRALGPQLSEPLSGRLRRTDGDGRRAGRAREQRLLARLGGPRHLRQRAARLRAHRAHRHRLGRLARRWIAPADAERRRRARCEPRARRVDDVATAAAAAGAGSREPVRAAHVRGGDGASGVRVVRRDRSRDPCRWDGRGARGMRARLPPRPGRLRHDRALDVRSVGGLPGLHVSPRPHAVRSLHRGQRARVPDVPQRLLLQLGEHGAPLLSLKGWVTRSGRERVRSPRADARRVARAARPSAVA
jgi:hypothetical protein